MEKLHQLQEELAQNERIRKDLEIRVEELTDFIENASLPLHWVDGEGIIIWANQAELDVFGYTREEYIGYPISNFHADQHIIDDILTRLVNNETLHNYPARVKCKNGTIKHVLINSNVLRKDDQFIHTRCFTRDITELINEEQKKAELLAKLEKSEEQFRMAVSSTKLGTWDYDPIGGGLNWSEECKKIFGLPLDTLVNFKLFTDHLFKDDRTYVEQQIQQSLDPSGDGLYDATYRIRCAKDQSIRWVRAQGKTYFNTNGQAERFLGTVVDITENKLWQEKSEKLAAIVESSDDAIISKTLNGTITSWNKAAERMFGYLEKEVLGKSITILIPEDRLEEEQLILYKIKNNEKVEHYQTYRVTKDKIEIAVSLTISPIRDLDGHVIGASKIARNISRQKAFEDKLQRYTDNVEILNTIGKLVSEHLDVDDILQQVIHSTTLITGATFGAFLYHEQNGDGGSNLLYNIFGATKEDFEEFLIPGKASNSHPMFKSKEIVRIVDIDKGFDKEKNPQLYDLLKAYSMISYLAVPVISKSGSVVGRLFYGHQERGRFTEDHESLLTGVAAQANIALDNAKLYEEIRKLNSKKDEFIGLASHELKTPVTTLNGYLQIVYKGLPEGDRNKGFIHKALQQIGNLSRLISELLDVSKIETGQLPLLSTSFDLLEFIKEVIELMQYTTKSHRIVLNADLGCLIISADKQRMEQVIINLISNAVKYSPEADLINISVSKTNEKAHVAVKDFGIGINEKQQEHIFSRFYRVEELAAHMSGLGIGLYISKEIISRHNGKLWVESELGHGSTFLFEIPIGQ